jgi:hypothetical protein
LKLRTADDTVKTNVLGFRDRLIIFYNTEQHVSDDEAYNKLMGKEEQ